MTAGLTKPFWLLHDMLTANAPRMQNAQQSALVKPMTQLPRSSDWQLWLNALMSCGRTRARIVAPDTYQDRQLHVLHGADPSLLRGFQPPVKAGTNMEMKWNEALPMNGTTDALGFIKKLGTCDAACNAMLPNVQQLSCHITLPAPPPPPLFMNSTNNQGKTRTHFVHAKLCRALLGASALIQLGHKSVGAWQDLGGAGSHVIPEQTLLRPVLPLCQQDSVQQAGSFPKTRQGWKLRDHSIIIAVVSKAPA